MNNRDGLFLILFLSLAAVFCARQGFPPGGPVDRTAPRVYATFPAADSIQIALDTHVEILFSEVVEHRSCEQSIFITPYPQSGVSYRWRGKKLLILFNQGLLQNRTYVITIGTGTQDRRNNAMKESFSLAFSTGSQLDRGQIEGRVFADGSLSGIQIWAYDLGQTPEPNPAEQSPIYITQAAGNGDYRLTNLAVGSYRIFALNDRDLNGKYDAEFDGLGVASKDIAIASEGETVSGIWLKVAVRDTTRPRLSGVSAIDQHHLDLRFSERMAPNFMSQPNNYLITSASDTLTVLDAFPDQRNTAYVHLTTTPQREDKYLIRVFQGFDLEGLPLLSGGDTLTFRGSVKLDTQKPFLVAMAPKDSAKNVALTTLLTFFFSETMKKASAEKQFALQDSSGQRVSGRFHWPNGATLEFLPTVFLQPEHPYQVRMQSDSVFDLAGNAFQDTLFLKRFQTLNPDTLSAIAGVLSDADSSVTGGYNLRIASKQGLFYEKWLDHAGPFEFPDIFPGLYVIELYNDQDENRRYSLGEAFPYQPAERFYVYPDTIQVRSRWPNEGNDIVLPR